MKLLSYKEVASALRVTRTTVERMVLRGDIPQPLIITPGVMRFDAEEFEEWLTNRPRGITPRGLV